jgi:5-methylcytosine-specific restriction enzyme subunit McrC
LSHSRPVLELGEWQTKELVGATLSPEDHRLVEQLSGEQGRLGVDELRTGVRVRAYSWVGLVRFATFEVRIEPKLTGDNLNLVEMLALASGLDALRRNIGTRQLRPEPGGDLLDLFALLLAHACERLASGGLLHDYVEYEADLPVLRGRLLADRQVRQRLCQIDRLECRYDDRSSDIAENQILTAALAACSRRVSHPTVRLCTRRMLSLFSAACSTAGLDLTLARETMTYNRLNQHYEEPHQLAWLVLDALGIYDLLASESTRCFAFLLDMNRLFELFILRFVQHVLRHRPYRVHYQHKTSSIIWDVAHNKPYTKVIPDLVIETLPPSSKRLVMDAKYKTYDEHRLSTADIYQSFLYAYAYSGREEVKPEALLLYPASLPRSSPVRLQIRSAHQRFGASIEAVGIHIPQALEEVKRGVPGPVTEALMEVIERPLGKP